jgi:hypothetical protein
MRSAPKWTANIAIIGTQSRDFTWRGAYTAAVWGAGRSAAAARLAVMASAKQV